MSSKVVVEPKTGLPSIGRFAGLLAASIVISGVLYGISATNIAPYLGGVSRPASDVPIWSILVLRIVELLGYSASGFSTSRDIISLSIISRTAYLISLHTTFTIPSWVLIMTLFIDTLSLWAPLTILQDGKPEGQQTKRIDVGKDWSLSIVLTLIGSSIMGIALYVAQKTIFPAFVVGHFDAVKNIMPLPLPLLVFGLIPTAYCVQDLVYTHGFHDSTIAMLTASFVVGAVNTALGVRGGDILGIFGIVQGWNIILLAVTSVLGFILQI